MKIKYFLIFAFASLILLVVLISAKLPAQNPCPINSNTNMVFYGETGFGGVGIPSRSWMIHFLNWWKQQDSSINYIELDSTDVKSDCNLANFSNLKLYIQPGGDAYKQQNKLSSTGKNNILNFIDSGKAYFGTCAGFYYAANDYYWQGTFYNHPYLLDRFPTVEGSITDIADYDSTTPYALTGLSNGRNAIYYGGPTLGWRNTAPIFPGIADSTFTAIPGNLPAVIKDGNMLLTSVHLEAFENDSISGLTTEERIENYKYLANLINEVARTNFYVPPYTNPPVCGNNIKEIGEICDGTDLVGKSCISQGFDAGNLTCASDCHSFDSSACVIYPKQCSDGIDNDGDFLIDYPNDPGCISASDNNETDVIGPVELFSDNFESGILSGWTTSAVSGGNVWQISNVNPYQGIYYVQSQPMSTTEPASILEKSISTSGYQNIKFSYYRRLVGLDSADEFKAKWFDGFAWNILEQTGSNSADDANYIYKEFLLPSSASNNPNFKIRFECTAGAVSEFCRVDNVQIISQ